MSKSKLFGRSRTGTGRGGTITMIEAPVWYSYRRKAKTAFFVTAGVVGFLAATVASHSMSPALGLIIGLLLGAACGTAAFVLVFTWPIMRIFWYWATEILTFLGVIFGWQALMESTNLWLSLTIVGVVAGVPATYGPIRRRITALGWCVIVRHRLRMCFSAFIMSNNRGNLPLILGARPTPAGERVWIWLRPGLALSDLEGRTDKLAVACWANEVRVVRASARFAALLRVDVTRRDPLTAEVKSPLPGLIPAKLLAKIRANAPVSPGMPPIGGLDLPDVPEEPLEDSTPARGRKPRNPNHSTDLGDPDDDADDYDFGSSNADWA